MSRDRITVGMAVSDDFVRAGLRAALQAAGVGVGPEAATVGALVRAGSGGEADLWLVDGGIEGGAVAAVHALADTAAEIVVLSDDDDTATVLAALEAGASGYLPTDTPAERLPEVLRAVLEGEAALPRKVMGRVIERLRAGHRRLSLTTADGHTVTLSPRESAVLEGLALGGSSQAIAAELGVSPVTVRRHASSAARKLGVDSRAAAVRLLAGQRG